MTILWSRTAVEDLQQLRSFIAQHDPSAAARTAGAILDAVDNLRRYPGMGRPGRLPGTRELIVAGTPCIVPYTVSDGVVQIITVLHSSRKWPQKR
jgi:toxin ParE1/3/4